MTINLQGMNIHTLTGLALFADEACHLKMLSVGNGICNFKNFIVRDFFFFFFFFFFIQGICLLHL